MSSGEKRSECTQREEGAEALQSLMEKLCLGKNATGRIQSMQTWQEFTEFRISILNFIPAILFSLSCFLLQSSEPYLCCKSNESNGMQYETSASRGGQC
jgi:hypothetical protein